MTSNTEGLVSVIIPTFNRSQSCKAAVESVLSQTYGCFEVIVIDDGSTDDTAKIFLDLDPRVKYIHQSNVGVSAARNTGLRATTGEFIAFLDSDDKWLSWKLEAQLKVLRTFPGAGMIWSDMKAVGDQDTIIYQSYLKRMYSAYEYFDRDRDFRESRFFRDIWDDCPQEYRERKCYTGPIFPWMFMGNLVHTSTVLLRKNRQTKVGFFDESLQKSGEDYDFHFRTCKEGEVAYLDAPTVLYRIGAADQLTNNKNMRWIAKNNLKTIQKMLKNDKNEITLPRELIRKRLAQSYAWVGITEFDNDRSASRRYLVKSLFFSPFQGKIAAYLLLSILPYSLSTKLINFQVGKKIR